MSESQAFASNPYYPDPEARGELEFHELTRAGREGVGWSLLAVVSAVIGFVGAQVIVVLAFLVYFAVAGEDVAEAVNGLVDSETLEPRDLFFLLTAISLAIPLMMLAHRAVTGLSPRWLISVAGRIRWVWLLVSMGIAVLALVFNIILATLLPTATVSDSGTGVDDFTSTTLQFLLVIVVLVPFQAAAEEYVFRGLMMQGCGSLVRNLWISRTVAVLVPALLFALAHGLGQSLPIFLDRLAFGVVAGVLAIGTGGIESGIGYHVVNNWLAFGIALFFGDLNDSLDPQGGNGWNVVVTLASSLFFLGAALGAARMMKLTTRVARTELERPQARV